MKKGFLFALLLEMTFLLFLEEPINNFWSLHGRKI